MSSHRAPRFETFELRRLLTATPQGDIESVNFSELSWIASSDPILSENTASGEDTLYHGFGCCCAECGRIQESAFENDNTAAGWDTGSAASITHVVTVQPIILSNDGGSNTAEYFGDSIEQAIIEDLIDSVWAQAGIDIDWLTPNSWNNTRENFGDRLPRPSSDLSRIVAQGDAAGVGNEDPLVLDMYFVEIAAGFNQLGNNSANGLAFLGGNGSTLHIGDNLPTFTSGREVVARVVAHEIGHNLGLAHVSDPPNLMDDGERLTTGQISTAIGSQFSIPLPENSAPTVSSPIDDVTAVEGSGATTIDLAPVFYDSDGDTLNFEVSSSDPNVIAAAIVDGKVELSYIGSPPASATITVTARDAFGASAEDEFLVSLLESPANATDWGSIDIQEVAAVNVSGPEWFRMEASRDGILTVAVERSSTNGDLGLTLYDTELNPVSTASENDGVLRTDTAVTSGQTLYLLATGSNAAVDFQLVNAVHPTANAVWLTSNSSDVELAFQAGVMHEIRVGGLPYVFTSQTYNAFTIVSEGANSRVSIGGLPTDDTAIFREHSLGMFGVGYGINVQAAEIAVEGMGGGDIAHFFDSPSDDIYEASSGFASMTYPNSAASAVDFSTVYSTSSLGGLDTATLIDSPQKDYFYAQPGYSYLVPEGGGYFLQAAGFRHISGRMQAGGGDIATLRDSLEDDELVAAPQNVRLAALNGFFSNEAIGFSTVITNSDTGGSDVARFTDGPSDDEYVSMPESAFMRALNGEFFHLANGFENYSATASNSGLDTAVFFDSSGDDTFVARPNDAYLAGPGIFSEASSFESYLAIADAGGNDTAVLFDSPQDDVLESTPEAVSIKSLSSPYNATANSFQSVHAIGSTGYDVAELFDSSQNDRFVARPEKSAMIYGVGNIVRFVNDFDLVTAHSRNGGSDTALMYDSTGNDIFEAGPAYVKLAAENASYETVAMGFPSVFGYSELGGSDQAIFHDSSASDTFVVTASVSKMEGPQAEFSNVATGFTNIRAYSDAGGNDSANLVDSTNSDLLQVGGETAILSGPGFYSEITGFEIVSGISMNGGDDELDQDAVDFLFNAVGPWL